ncbi:MAG: alpha-L-arabinofuranosidase C-terminal domain-containing protein [Clostridia bacterium]|nr:alpha-L-arabinofuranosidase C-terminal domain-containing protein [Clostridia bacterium]
MAKITVNVSRGKGMISRNLYGHFSEHLGRCIYDGLFVGKDSPIENVNGMRKAAVDALKAIGIPVLRWPGGCFADEYHWRDGVGADRKRMVNTNWGGVTEDNSFGTHEFMELCRQLGCEPYVNANVGSGTVQEMSEWVEYLNSDSDSTVVRERWANGSREPFGVRFWGVGNENWGCGGNMRPEYYADEFRRYQTFCRNYGENKLYKIACGPSGGDVNWTEVLMKNAGRYMDGLTMHYYTVPGPWEDKGPATGFSRDRYMLTLRNAEHIAAVIDGHLKVMDRYDPEHRVGLIVDEWGTWYDVEKGTNPGFLYQQNTMRDAQVAALTLNIFNDRCDRVVMANIAQTVNVLQAMILTEGEKIVLTPTYHVFALYKAHHDAQHADTFITDAGEVEGLGISPVSASASVKNGAMTVTVSNMDPDHEKEIIVEPADFAFTEASGRVLAGEMGAYNDFDASPLCIRPLEGIAVTAEKTVKLTLPACSVCELTLR